MSDQVTGYRGVLVVAMRALADAIDLEVEKFGDSVQGDERWEHSFRAIVPEGVDRSFADYYNSDFADLAYAYADYLENPELSEDDAFNAAADEVEDGWTGDDDDEFPEVAEVAAQVDPQQALKVALVQFGNEIDISHEEARTYKFLTAAGMAEVTIDCPATIRVVDDHHFITDTTGVVEIVPPGWLSITVYPFGHGGGDAEEAA